MNIRNSALLIIAVFCIGVVGYIVFAKGRFKKPLQQGFVIQLNHTIYRADGSSPTLDSRKVRYYKADGSWKMVTTEANGRVRVGYGDPVRGVFDLNEKDQKLFYVGAAASGITSEEDLKASEGFVGEEAILGFRTLHFHLSEAGGQTTDLYICPSLQNYPLKTVTVSAKGVKTVWEPVSVTAGEPSFETMPNLAIDYSRFEQTHPAR